MISSADLVNMGYVVIGDAAIGMGITLLVVDDKYSDINLSVFAPEMSDASLRGLVTTIRDRLKLALAGLDNQGIIGVNNGNHLNSVSVVANNSGYQRMVSAGDLVRQAAKAIAEASEYNRHRSVHVLGRYECLVLVDWSEIDDTSGQFVLRVPNGVGLDSDRANKLEAKCSVLNVRGMATNAQFMDDGSTRITVRTLPDGPRVSHALMQEQVKRVLFVLGTMLTLRGINDTPVVGLTYPFVPYADEVSNH